MLDYQKHRYIAKHLLLITSKERLIFCVLIFFLNLAAYFILKYAESQHEGVEIFWFCYNEELLSFS